MEGALMTNHDLTYVTQEMWDRAQEALKSALPIIEAHTPPLSTAGTMVSLRAQVRAAIVGAGIEPQVTLQLPQEAAEENTKLRQIIADVMFREMSGLKPVLRTGDVEWAGITPKSGVEPTSRQSIGDGWTDEQREDIRSALNRGTDT